MLSRTDAAPRVEDYCALRRRTARDRSGRYVIEGAAHLHAALETRTPLDGLLLCDELLAPKTRDIVKAAIHRGVPVRHVTKPEFKRASRANDPTGLAAVAHIAWTEPERPRPGSPGVYLALGRVRSPGNLGTMLRTAAAAGVAGVLFTDFETDPFDPIAVRATMGAVCRVPMSRMRLTHLEAWKRRVGAVVVGSSAKAQRPFDRMPRRRPLVVMVGCERRGMTRAQRRLCDVTVTIPMVAGVSSLNVAVATGVLLFGARRTGAG